MMIAPASALRWIGSIALAIGLAACDAEAPPTAGAPATMRVISEAQYRNIIADVFGTDIVVAGRFDSPQRTDGLQRIGAGRGAITPSAFERYDHLARAIAAQVIDPAHRTALVPCRPAATTGADAACAEIFLATTGLHLFRRPLSTDELKSRVEIATASAEKVGDFYAGLGTAMATLLVSPHFLFISDTTAPDPTRPGDVHLTDYARAERLSFFFWNAGPDDELLAAAGRGELATADGVAKQVERLASSPRLEAGVRAFFSDMLGFDKFDTLSKDSVIYPAFSSGVVADAKEQTLRTIVDHVVEQQADYRDLFVTRKTQLSGPLAIIYRVPTKRPSGWVAYEFPENSPHIGILSHLSFVALHSHPGKSSPTQRGRALRELLLCQKVPDPPGDVSFDGFNDPQSPKRTARERLAAHNADPTCAGCHRLTDPVGLALEAFDGAGQYRTHENGAVIDTAGELDGRPFTDTRSLAVAVRDNPAAVSCIASRAFSYAVQRSPMPDERTWLDALATQFARSGHRFPELMKRIALSEAFFAVAPPTVAADVSQAGEKRG